MKTLLIVLLSFTSIFSFANNTTIRTNTCALVISRIDFDAYPNLRTKTVENILKRKNYNIVSRNNIPMIYDQVELVIDYNRNYANVFLVKADLETSRRLGYAANTYRPFVTTEDIRNRNPSDVIVNILRNMPACSIL